MHIHLTVNYANGDEYYLDVESDTFGQVMTAVQDAIDSIDREKPGNYSSLVVTLVPKE